jgi:hypothetical protein
VGDAVLATTPNECHVTGDELERRLWVVEPHPGLALDDGVDGELVCAGEAQPPRGSYD